MACFVAPAAAALVTTTLKKKVPEQYHVEWLLSMLWGGVLMLIVDHAISKEIVPYFPFFTKSWNEIWLEIIKVGIPMTFIVFAVWGSMIFGMSHARRRKLISTISINQ